MDFTTGNTEVTPKQPAIPGPVKITVSYPVPKIGTHVIIQELHMQYYGSAVQAACKKYEGKTGRVSAHRPTKFKPVGVTLDKLNLLLWVDTKEVKPV